MIDRPTPPPGARRPASRRRVRRILLAAIGLLYVVSVPWYRADDAGLRVWLGLPDWVAVAVVCYAAVAVLNALAWLFTDVDDGAPLPAGLGDDAPPPAAQGDA